MGVVSVLWVGQAAVRAGRRCAVAGLSSPYPKILLFAQNDMLGMRWLFMSSRASSYSIEVI
jgi:hypothetical protein